MHRHRVLGALASACVTISACGGATEDEGKPADSGVPQSDSMAIGGDSARDGAGDGATGAFTATSVVSLGESVTLKALATAPGGTSALLVTYARFDGAPSVSPLKRSGKIVWFDAAGARTGTAELRVNPTWPASIALDKSGKVFAAYNDDGTDSGCTGATFASTSGGVVMCRALAADGTEWRPAIAADGNGGAYLGERRASLDGTPSSLGPFLAVHIADDGTIGWRLRAREAPANCAVEPCAGGAESIAVDSGGNLYVTSFNPVTTAGTTYPTGFAVTKIDAAGKVLWSKKVPGTKLIDAACGPLSITVTESGATVVGTFTGTLTFPDAKPLDAGASEALFVARFSFTGAVVWTRAFPGVTTACFRASSFGDRTLLGGTFSGKLSIGGDVVDAAAGVAALAVLANDGTPLRATKIGPFAPSFAAMAGNMAVVAGEYSDVAASVLNKSAPFKSPGPNVFVAHVALP